MHFLAQAIYKQQNGCVACFCLWPSISWFMMLCSCIVTYFSHCQVSCAFLALLKAQALLTAPTSSSQAVCMMVQVHTTMQACSASQVKLAKVCRNGAMSSLVAKHPDPSPSLVVTSALSSMSLCPCSTQPDSRHQTVTCTAAAVILSKHSCFSLVLS